MALGADDVQAAQRHDALVLGVGFLLEALVELAVALTRVQHDLIDVFVVAGGCLDDLVGVVFLPHGAAGQKVRIAAQQDVRAAAGHVGGDGHGPHVTGLGHDLGFLLVILGVEHLMAHAAQLDEVGEHFAGFHVDGAHQNRLAGLVTLDDLLDDGVELAALGLVDHVVEVLADHGLVGGNLHHVQVVDALEFLFLGLGGAGHAADLFVHAEVVLEGNGGQRLALALHLDVLLGFDGLMQAVGVAAAHHQTAGELVHDDDLAVLHHVVHVALHDGVGLERREDMVVELGVVQVGDVFDVEGTLGLGDALLGKGDGLLLLGDGVVLLVFEAADELVGLLVQVGGLVPLTGDDQRRARLVDEDGVHLVHDGVDVAALHHVALVDDHVVAQVVKAHLVVGAVGDVAGVGGAALGVVQVVHDQAHGEAHELVDLAHPLAVAAGQVVVDGHDVHAFAGQGVEVGGQSGHQRLALAGLHLRDAALMQAYAADHLHGIGPEPYGAVGGLAAGGEGVGQNIVQRFAGFEALLELRRLGLELLVRQRAVLGFLGQHLVGNLLQAPDLGFIALAKQLLEYFHHSQGGKSPYLWR